MRPAIPPTAPARVLATHVAAFAGTFALLALPVTAHAATPIYLPVALDAGHIAPTPLPTPTSTAEPASALAVGNVAVLSDANDVRDLAVDGATGDAWAATYGGVVRWAAGGVTATVTTGVDDLWLAADDVAVGPHGDVWAVTDRGVAWRAADGTWTAVQPPPLPTPPAGGDAAADGIAKPVIPRSVAVDAAGDVWIGLDGGVAKRTPGGRWSHLLGFEGAIDRIVPAPGGDVWVTTPFDRRTPIQRVRADGGRSSFASGVGGLRVKRPVDVAAAPDGAIWALDALGPPVVVDTIGPGGADPPWRSVPLGDLDLSLRKVSRPGPLRRVVFDAAGAPVIAAEGVLLVAEGGSASPHWSVSAVDDGPLAPLRELRALATASDGSVWVGGAGGIAVRAPSGGITRRTVAGLSSNAITALALAPDGTWFGTRYGADRLAPDGSLVHLDIVAAGSGDPPLGPADARVLAIAAAPDGALWFATPRGVVRRAPDGDRTAFGKADGLVDPFTSALAIGADGSLWCASGQAGQAADGRGNVGVSRRLPDGTWVRYGYDDGLPVLEPTAILPRRDGSVWVGFNTQLAWLDQPFGGRNMAFYRPEQGWTRVAPPEPLSRDAVFALAETPDGALWILSARGLSRLTADGRWTTYADQPRWTFGATREAGALVAGADGSVFVGSRWAPLHVRRPDGTWRVAAPALASDAVGDIAVGADGRVWVGTAERGARAFDWAP